MRGRCRFACICLGLSCFLFGCGRREFAAVEGRVTLDGKPLSMVEVVFLPDPEKGNLGNRASAYTDENGHYRLHCGRDKQDGTLVGPHRVCIYDITVSVDEETGKPIKPSRVPANYGNPAETPFRDVEVKPVQQTLDFDVKRAGKS